jgi:hypothetical protein
MLVVNQVLLDRDTRISSPKLTVDNGDHEQAYYDFTIDAERGEITDALAGRIRVGESIRVFGYDIPLLNVDQHGMVLGIARPWASSATE